MKRKLFVVAVVGLVIFTWAHNSSAAEPIRIGSLPPLSGTDAYAGIAQKQTYEMMAAKLNNAGGINGRPIKIIYYDVELKPDIAVSMAKRLIEKDQVTAILGPPHSITGLATVSSIEKAEIPTFLLGSSDLIDHPVKKWIFKVVPHSGVGVNKLLGYMKSQGIQRIALMTSQDAYGDDGRRYYIEGAPKYGIKIVFEDKYTMQDMDVSPILNKIKRTDAQAVANYSPYRAPIMFTMTYRRMGIELPLFMSPGDLSHFFLETAGKAAEGVILPSYKFFGTKDLLDSDPQKKVILDYMAMYKEKYGKEAEHFGGTAYDAFTILIAALKKAGDDKSKLRDAIEQTRGFVGAMGIFDYSPTVHGCMSENSFAVYKVVGGDFKLITY